MKFVMISLFTVRVTYVVCFSFVCVGIITEEKLSERGVCDNTWCL